MISTCVRRARGILLLALTMAVGIVAVWAISGSASAQAESRVAQISAGGDHTCAVLESGGLLCWGKNIDDQADPAAGQYQSVVTGADHSCALTTTRQARCWGANSQGQSLVPEPHDGDEFIQIAAGGNSTCGVAQTTGYKERGAFACWGVQSSSWAVNLGVWRPIRTMVGAAHRCYETLDRGVQCAGNNDIGQAQNFGSDFAEWTTGDHHNCVRTSAGAVSCWGSDLYGQTQVVQGSYISVSAGASHTCAILVSGSIRCWGRNNHEQTEAPAGSNWELAAAGGSHSCAVNDNGKVACWGRNNHGQLNVPAAIAATPTVLRHAVRVTASPANAGTVSGHGDLLRGSTATLRATPAEGYRFVRWVGDASGTSTLVRIVVDEDKTVYAVFEPAGSGPDETPMIGDGTMTADIPAGRIVARRLDDGRTEFGYQPSGGERVLPSSRYFPANATVDRWLNSSAVIVDGEEIGRINARLLADGRIEFAFTPADGERILPATRYFPVSSSGGWLRSSVIGG